MDAMSAEFLGFDDGEHAFEILFASAAEQEVIETPVVPYLLAGDAESLLEGGFGFGGAVAEAGFEFGDGGWGEENGDERFGEGGDAGGLSPHAFGTLDIDVEQHIEALGEFVEHFGLESSVAISEDGGVF